MSLKTNRRQFLQTVAGAALTVPVLAQQPTARITATKLADSFTLVSGAGSNVLVVRTPEGMLVVDGGLLESSIPLFEFISQQIGPEPLRILFNTHWHLENTGANERLGRAGNVKIISHENTRLWMTRDILVEWQNNKVYPTRAKEAQPTDTFLSHESPKQLTFGNVEVRYGLLPQAHTDGDIYVFFPGPDILMAGDVVSVGSYPILDYSTGGWIGGMANASRDLLQLSDAQTKIIPGSGAVQAKAYVQAQADMLNTVRTRLVTMMKQGYGAKDMAAKKPTQEFDAKWGDPTLFMNTVYPGLWGHVRELGGII
jgi:glyoxylase-like metal-dependent hydrolase (beta-lactamase superfamily II)